MIEQISNFMHSEIQVVQSYIIYEYGFSYMFKWDWIFKIKKYEKLIMIKFDISVKLMIQRNFGIYCLSLCYYLNILYYMFIHDSTVFFFIVIIFLLMDQPKYSKELLGFAKSTIFFQVVMVFMYGFFVVVQTDVTTDYLSQYYPFFQDITVMMLIGFGYLMTILRTNGWSALGFTFFINAIVAQEYLLFRGFWEKVFTSFADTTIEVTLVNFMQSSFAVAGTLIAFGAVIGRVGPFELFIMAIVQVVGHSLNERIIYEKPFSVYDYGGSMGIHTFGAIYGLTVSFIVGRKTPIGEVKSSTDYISGIYSFIGTLFLWLFWPSFNAGSVPAIYEYMRLNAIINTVLSLTGSCLISFTASIFLRGKIAADDILNATLAGGVAIGAPCTIVTNPAGALAVGIIAGFISTVGFAKISTTLAKIGIYDTVGIANLHAIPGLLGGFFSAIFIASYNLNPPEVGKASIDFGNIDYMRQGGMQILGTLISFGLAFGFGIVSGLFMNIFYQIENSDFFEDGNFWETYHEGYPGIRTEKKLKI